MTVSCGVLCSFMAIDSKVGLAGDAAKFGPGLADAVVHELQSCGSSGVVVRGNMSESNRPCASAAP